MALLVIALLAIIIWLLIDRQKLSERNAVLESHLHNHTSTVVERDAKMQRAQNDMLNGMLRKTENTIMTLVGVVKEIWEGARDIDALTIKVLQEGIHHIAALYAGRITRGLILVPDPRDPNWLVCYASVGIDPPSTQRRHYIGPTDSLTNANQYKSGVAGEVYLQREPQLVHVDRQTKEADSTDYEDYRGADREFCPYESFVAMPIRLGPDDENLLGVLCLDSPYHDTFDADPACESVAHLLRVICYLLRMRNLATASLRIVPRTGAKA